MAGGEGKLMLEAAIVIGLAAFALTFLLKDTDGPWDVFAKVRGKAIREIRHIDEYFVTTYTPKHPFWFNWYACFWCMTTWFSAALAAIYVVAFGMPWYAWIFMWLASIAISGSIYTLLPDK